MTHNHTGSVAELRRESEQTRAALSQTVETLRSRITDTAEDIRQKVSPEHIKSEVSDYVAEKGRHWFDNLKQQAMENPMQALAAGTALAVPAFKMIRSVPLPLLMIGAGLALSSSRVRGAVADQMSATLKTADGNVVDDAADLAREGWKSAKIRTERVMDDARNVVTDKAAELRDAASQMAGTVRERAEEFSAAAKDNLSSKVNTASEAAKDAFDATRTKVAESFSATRASAETVVRDNAALVGGIGLAIGALIAASLPSTRVERATLGGASDTLRDKAADVAGEKFEEVKTAAISAAESVAGKISDAALGSDMTRVAADAADKTAFSSDGAQMMTIPTPMLNVLYISRGSTKPASINRQYAEALG